jgi:hypothetical protein
MAGDTLRHVRPGQPLSIPAAAYNAFVDAAFAYRQTQVAINAGPVPLLPAEQTAVFVKNDSGGDVPRFGVLGLDAPLISPADNELEFAARVTFRGVLPSASTRGRFAVLQEPLAQGRIGRAVISGVTIGRIAVAGADVDFRWADIKAASTAALQPDPDGAAQILWLESRVEGEHWAIVRLGVPRRTYTFPVRLMKISGAAGSATAPASWRYIVLDAIDGSVIYDWDADPTASPHAWRRPAVGVMTQADAGLAYIDQYGVLILTWINEVAEQEAC